MVWPILSFQGSYRNFYITRIFSPKLGNVHITLIYLLLSKILLRILSGTVWFDSILLCKVSIKFSWKTHAFFLFQNTLRFQKLESRTIWFELYRLFRKQWSILIKSTNSKLRSRLNMVWTKLFFQSFYLSKLFFATWNIFEKF